MVVLPKPLRLNRMDMHAHPEMFDPSAPDRYELVRALPSPRSSAFRVLKTVGVG